MNTTAPSEREMSAKFAGTCRRCGDPIAVGDRILYSKATGTRHAIEDECAGEQPSAAFTPTSEQDEALAAFATGKSLVIEAGAGTGKTATLVLLARSTGRRGQYIAFNSAIVKEAGSKMPANVACSTAHSLAYRSVMPGTRFPERLKNSRRMKSNEIADRLRVDAMTVNLPGGEQKRLARTFLAGLVMRGVTRFCQSADAQPEARHIPYVDGLDIPPGARANNDAVARALVPAMRRAWADLTDEQGSLPFKHDHYLKLWHLSGPKIAADFILFDEAQDANPVLMDIVRQQTHAQLVWVGDSQQQIYTFTGAVNALQRVGAEQTTYLTQSFRFGPAVAAKANEVLAMLPDAILRLTGTPTIESVVGPVEDPAVILCRTNARAVRHLLDAIKQDRRPHIVGGGREVVDFAQAAKELMEEGFTGHPELACFATWGEVQMYVEQDEQGGDLRLLVKLIDEFGVDVILAALVDMPKEADADVVISTAHKAKGREWDSVQLADDFPPEPSGEELRLLYVAVTRAKLLLDVAAVKLLDGGFAPEEEYDVLADDAAFAEANAEWAARNPDEVVEPVSAAPAAPSPEAPAPVSDDEDAAEGPMERYSRTTVPATPEATVAEDLAGRPGVFHLWADGLMLGEHHDSRVAIDTASKLYSGGRFRVVNVYSADGNLVVQYEA